MRLLGALSFSGFSMKPVMRLSLASSATPNLDGSFTLWSASVARLLVFSCCLIISV